MPDRDSPDAAAERESTVHRQWRDKALVVVVVLEALHHDGALKLAGGTQQVVAVAGAAVKVSRTAEARVQKRQVVVIAAQVNVQIAAADLALLQAHVVVAVE